MVADAMTLQMRLPPPGVQLPGTRSSRDVAGGAPMVEACASTSAWVVQVLKGLSQVREETVCVCVCVWWCVCV